jgi:hypothetical protein
LWQNDWWQNYFFVILDSDDANRPVGTAITPIPIRETIEANIFPATVMGYMSPYPIVVNVTTDHHKE